MVKNLILLLLILGFTPALSQPASERHEQLPSEVSTGQSPFGLEFSYIVDALSNLSGGLDTGSDILGSLLLDFVLDAEQSLGWRGATFEASVLAIHGGPFSDFVGDFQTVSNIEAPETVRLFRAYLQQRFLEDRLSVILGLYNVDSEFDTRETADLFVHSSPGTGGDIGQLGTNGPGIFPVGALGSRIRYEDNGWYGQLAFTEGEPGDPDDPFGTTFSLDDTEGAFLIGELGKTWADEHGFLGKVAIGGWGFTTGFPTHLDPNASVSNRGAYLSLEKKLHRESDPSQGLAGYLRVGRAEGRVNPIETFAGAGFVYTGAFPGRDADMLGIAVNTGFTGRDFQESGPFDTHETALELTYSFAINENVTVQPDLQYIINPGFDPTLENSLVVGLRATWAFSI